MVFMCGSARIALVLLACIVLSTSAADGPSLKRKTYGDVCEERIADLDIVLLVDECK